MLIVPIIIEAHGFTMSAAAVIPTSPERIPTHKSVVLALLPLYKKFLYIQIVKPPEIPDKVVFTFMIPTRILASLNLNKLPLLKPHQLNHRMQVPKCQKGILKGSKSFYFVLSNLPILSPKIFVLTSPTTPDNICIAPSPAFLQKNLMII